MERRLHAATWRAYKRQGDLAEQAGQTYAGRSKSITMDINRHATASPLLMMEQGRTNEAADLLQGLSNSATLLPLNPTSKWPGSSARNRRRHEGAAGNARECFLRVKPNRPHCATALIGTNCARTLRQASPGDRPCVPIRSLYARLESAGSAVANLANYHGIRVRRATTVECSRAMCHWRITARLLCPLPGACGRDEAMMSGLVPFPTPVAAGPPVRQPGSPDARGRPGHMRPANRSVPIYRTRSAVLAGDSHQPDARSEENVSMRRSLEIEFQMRVRRG